jgi:predicted nuclease of predicted toxin-antitoxin system
MKLLFDQNLSFKLIPAVSSLFPGSRHLKDFDLTRELDGPIWHFAADNNFTIVSKDTDFMNHALVLGHPPKVIYIRLGNCSTKLIVDRLLSEEQTIRNFIVDPISSLLTIS